MQLSHPEMTDAKEEAHKHYEIMRTTLPQFCEGTDVDAAVLEHFIAQLVLDMSSFDFAIGELQRLAQCCACILLLACMNRTLR